MAVAVFGSSTHAVASGQGKARRAQTVTVVPETL